MHPHLPLPATGQLCRFDAGVVGGVTVSSYVEVLIPRVDPDASGSLFSLCLGFDSSTIELPVCHSWQRGNLVDEHLGMEQGHGPTCVRRRAMSVLARHGGQRTRVLVADDHPLTRMGLCRLLARSGMDVVAEAGDGEEAVRQAIATRPDIALLDVLMPGLGGLEAARRIASACLQTRVVMLSGQIGEEQIADARKAGAVAYITKGSTTQEIMAILDAVREGRRAGGGASVEAVAGHASGTIRAAGGFDLHALTERELEVLGLVARGHTSAAVARTLHLSERTVEKHRQNIMQKLGVHSVVQLTRIAIRSGLA